MQPSDPTEEEVTAREQLVAWIRSHAALEYGDPNSHPVSKRRWERDMSCGVEDIDAYAHAVYQRGLRDALAVVEEVPRHDWSMGTLVDRNEALAAIRALTPPEPTE